MDETLLNRQIAEAFGYYIVPRPVSWRYEIANNTVYELFRTDGTKMGMGIVEGEAWQHAPNFAHSLDATLAALPESMDIVLQEWKGKYRCILLPLNGEGEGTSRQEAAARALLAWALAQKLD